METLDLKGKHPKDTNWIPDNCKSTTKMLRKSKTSPQSSTSCQEKHAKNTKTISITARLTPKALIDNHSNLCLCETPPHTCYWQIMRIMYQVAPSTQSLRPKKSHRHVHALVHQLIPSSSLENKLSLFMKRTSLGDNFFQKYSELLKLLSIVEVLIFIRKNKSCFRSPF